MAISLENRSLQLVTPLGHDALLPERIDIVEGLGRPFQWTLDLLSENGNLNGDNLLGKDVTLAFKLPQNGATRYFNGYVTEFAQVGYRQRVCTLNGDEQRRRGSFRCRQACDYRESAEPEISIG